MFAAGRMAKPMVITLPFVLLLLDYWPLGRTMGSPACAVRAPQWAVTRLLLEKIPLLVLSAASAWITLKAQRAAIRTLQQSPLAVRIENAIVSYGLYLWKMLWPGRLAALYPYPTNTLPVWQVTLSALMLLVVTALVVVFRRKRYLPVGWFWFLGTLIPVIGLVQVGEAAMADRYAYVPLIGIFVMIAWGLDDWAEARKVRTVWRVIPALCVLTALGLATSHQMSYWESEYSLWSHTLAVTERNAYADAALGATLMDPALATTWNNLEGLDTEQKRMDEARRHYEEALEFFRQLVQQSPDAYLPDMATTFNNLGNLDRLQNRTDEARQHYEQALQYYHQLAQQNPEPHLLNMATTLSNLAAVDRRQNRLDDARQQLEEALKIHRQLAQQNPAAHLPDVALILNNLENLDGLQKRVDEARKHFEDSLRTYRQLAQQNPAAYLPGVAMALSNLGNFETAQNRTDDARQHFEEALRIDRQLAEQNPDAYLPGMAGTLNNLGRLDKNQNRIEASRAHYTEALTIYRKLAQRDAARYAGDAAEVEASLQELDKKVKSR